MAEFIQNLDLVLVERWMRFTIVLAVLVLVFLVEWYVNWRGRV